MIKFWVICAITVVFSTIFISIYKNENFTNTINHLRALPLVAIGGFIVGKYYYAAGTMGRQWAKSVGVFTNNDAGVEALGYVIGGLFYIICGGLRLIMIGAVIKYILSLWDNYNAHKNFVKHDPPRYVLFQKMNTKLFKKCFEINPDAFMFEEKHDKHRGYWTSVNWAETVITYNKFLNMTSAEKNEWNRNEKMPAYVGIDCDFWCYLTMYDAIKQRAAQKQKEADMKAKAEAMRALNAKFAEAPITKDIVSKVENQLEENRRLMEEATRNYHQLVNDLISSGKFEENKMSDELEVKSEK